MKPETTITQNTVDITTGGVVKFTIPYEDL